MEANGDGWTPLLALICCLTTLGAAVPVGYFLGVMNSLAQFIKPWCLATVAARYGAQLSASGLNVLWASIVSVFPIGGIAGSFVGAWCCNRYGRRGCLYISALLLLIAAVLLQFCRSANAVEMLLLGRLIAGMAAALIFTAHIMYLIELAPAKVRSSLGVFTSIGVTSGICLGQVFSLQQVFGNERLWHHALSLYAVFVLVGFLPALAFPESPRWLYLIRQNAVMARAALRRIRGSGPKAEQCIETDLSAMQSAAMTTTNSDKTTFLAVWRNRKLLLPLVLVISYGFCQQLAGINAMFYYSIPVYTKAGFSTEDAAWINLSVGVLNVIVTALVPFIMANFNRRPVIMTSATGCAFALVGMAFGLNYIDLAVWLPVFCMLLIAAFIIFFDIGMGPCPYFLGTELFEVAPRGVAMGMASLSSWFGNFLIGMFFPLVESAWGPFCFLPCCVVCIYCVVLTWLYLPETRVCETGAVKVGMTSNFKCTRNSIKN